MAKIYLKGGTEKTLILAVREAFYEPFSATNWTDLRLGFLVSLCGNADPGEDDTITGLTETIGSTPSEFLPWTDRFSLGLTDSRSGTVFLGYTNKLSSREPSTGSSKLISSDGAIGTTNTNFWRVHNGMEVNGVASLAIVDTNVIRARSVDGSQIHFIQDTTGAGGYATLVALRFQRDNARGREKIITMTVKKNAAGHTGDILYTNTPSETVLEDNMRTFPTTVQQLGPVELSQVPDTIWAYWPFSNSRLRIHCYGILRAAAA